MPRGGVPILLAVQRLHNSMLQTELVRMSQLA